MSGWVPRDQYVNNLSVEQLKDFYVKSDPRAKKMSTAPAPRRQYTKKAFPSAVSGRGAYSTDASKKKKRAPGSVPNKAANTNFRSDYGARLGSVVGEGIQSFANALGFGEYDIQQNACLSQKYIDMGTSPPRVKNTNKGEATVFNHREYLGELITGAGTPSAFALQSYTINPGNSTLFPFASRLAENFQEWEIRGMLVELKSEASNTSTTLNMGSMFVAVDYNVLDPAPVNKIELENLEYACSNKPSESILMPIECARKNDVLTHLYVAVDEEYYSGDPRLYDIGQLFIGSFGCPAAAAPIAEIWVTYEIALFKPHIHQEEPPALVTLVQSTHWSGVTAISPTEPLGSPVEQDGGTTGFTVTNSAGSSIIDFPHVDEDSTYLVNLWWRTQGTITAPAAPTVSPVGGSDIMNNFWSGIAGNNAQAFAYTPASPLISSDSFSLSFCVEVLGGVGMDGGFQLTGGTITSASQPSYWDLVISRMENTQTLDPYRASRKKALGARKADPK